MWSRFGIQVIILLTALWPMLTCGQMFGSIAAYEDFSDTDNCGTHCESCLEGFYQDPALDIKDPEICKRKQITNNTVYYTIL